ncbi:ABC transporter substrate-binding protein [Alcaligenes faecalis subsp. faecalis]|uniref:ABC transporter substrate-binding protein n=1 Tax=Alcaligenes faecalis TaxID=511 RepID=UPI001F25E657|nr:ABC transporter substrate-binding protein [Alcaligenes faecalis]MBW4789677.1 ABC transporter substrate-binding protein [Alcaligenes faecalis subsp. faecalis]
MIESPTSRTRRDLLKLASLLTVAGAAPLLAQGAARAQSESNAPLRIGYLPITDATGMLVAHHNGYFEEAGIAVEKPVMVRSWAQLVEAFISGQVNLVHLLSPMTVWARYGSKVPAKVVAWNHMSGSAITVAQNISSAEQLGGQTVAIPFWYSIHNVVLQHVLKAHGLTPVVKNAGALAPNEVNLVVMAPADMPPALASGRIAGFTVAEPFNALAETQGMGRILRFTGDVWRDHACCVAFMHEQDLQTRPQWSQGVVDGLVKAQIWIRSNRAEAAQILSREGGNRYTPHTQENLLKVLSPDPADRAQYVKSGVIRHPDWDDQRIDFQPYPFPSYTESLVQMLQGTLIQGERGFLEGLSPEHVASDLVDDRFVRAALEKQGGLAQFGLSEQYSRNESIVV